MLHSSAPTRSRDWVAERANEARGHARSLKWLASLAVAVGLVAGAASFVMPHATAETADSASPIRQVGTLERIGQDVIDIFGDVIVPDKFFEPVDTPERYAPEGATTGTMIVAAEARQLWQFYPYVDLSGQTGVVVRDLDTLKIIHAETVPVTFQRGTVAVQGGEWAHALDGGKRLLMLAVDPAGVVSWDLRSFARKHYPYGPPIAVAGIRTAGLAVGGITYDPVTDGVLVLAGGVASGNAANTNTVIGWIDLETGATQGYYVRSCTGPLPATDQSTTYGTTVVTSDEYIYIPCHRAGQVGAVARIGRAWIDGGGQVDAEDVTVGPVYLETSLADQASKRLFLMTILGEIWAFDTSTMSFIGVVGAHTEETSTVSMGYGIDPRSGRLFFQSGTYGFGVVEGRFFPIPQARTLPSAATPAQERIMSDSVTGRVFVLPGAGTYKPHRYTIYQVGDAPTPPRPPDPDRNTADVDEKDGVTERRYLASGSGYGVRVLLAKGLSTVPPAPTVGVLAPTAQAIDKNLNSNCGYTDRELVAGRVAKAEYDHGSTAASAIAVGIDDRTGVDLALPSRCDITVRSGSSQLFQGVFATEPTKTALADYDQGPGWEHKPATCSSSEGGEAANGKPDDGTQRPLGDSHVDCPVPDTAKALEAYAQADLRGGIDVGKAWTRTTIKRTSRGVEAIVESKAQDIDIADGAIKIREVRSKATSRANGRPQRNDMSVHQTYLKGVVLGGTTLCEERCDPGAVIDALNVAAAGRARFHIASGIDPELQRGSSKGALTAIQKSVQRQASDRALVGDFTTEVPGFEMIVYNDNKEWGRARQLYQFAGVSSAANYNIIPLPTGREGNGDSDGDDVELALDPSGEIGDSILPGVDSLPDGTPIARLGSDSDEGGPIARALSALARGLRVFFSNPRQGLLLLTAWALLTLPAVLSRRRRLLVAARSE